MAETDDSGPRKLKLRRPKLVIKQEVIQKNLEPLLYNIEKKKRAQEFYYENKEEMGLSPLMRDFKRRPVHQRLGRRVPFNGTNTSAIPPKRKLRRPGMFNNQNHPRGFNNERRLRAVSAQQRINRIRANQQQQYQNQNVPKRIKLRRTLPNTSPTHLTVEVKNNNALFRKQQFNNGHRFKMVLSSYFQADIKRIQQECQSQQITSPIKVRATATATLLNVRFADHDLI